MYEGKTDVYIYIEYRKNYLLTIREIKKVSGAAARTSSLM